MKKNSWSYVTTPGEPVPVDNTPRQRFMSTAERMSSIAVNTGVVVFDLESENVTDSEPIPD